MTESSNDRPDPGQPGSGSTPSADGADTADLTDRTGAGVPSANQGKAEPIRPGASDDTPDETADDGLSTTS